MPWFSCTTSSPICMLAASAKKCSALRFFLMVRMNLSPKISCSEIIMKSLFSKPSSIGATNRLTPLLAGSQLFICFDFISCFSSKVFMCSNEPCEKQEIKRGLLNAFIFSSSVPMADIFLNAKFCELCWLRGESVIWFLALTSASSWKLYKASVFSGLWLLPLRAS